MSLPIDIHSYFMTYLISLNTGSVNKHVECFVFNVFPAVRLGVQPGCTIWLTGKSQGWITLYNGWDKIFAHRKYKCKLGKQDPVQEINCLYSLQTTPQWHGSTSMTRHFLTTKQKGHSTWDQKVSLYRSKHRIIDKTTWSVPQGTSIKIQRYWMYSQCLTEGRAKTECKRQYQLRFRTKRPVY